MSLYDVILKELNDDTTTWIHLMEHDKIRVAEKIAKAVERHDNINLLAQCANLRGADNFQHRTIDEFSQFIENVTHNEEDIWKKYQFDWSTPHAIRIWIQKFYDYCKDEYKH